MNNLKTKTELLESFKDFKNRLISNPTIFQYGEKLKYTDDNDIIRYCTYI